MAKFIIDSLKQLSRQVDVSRISCSVIVPSWLASQSENADSTPICCTAQLKIRGIFSISSLKYCLSTELRCCTARFFLIFLTVFPLS